MGPYSHGTFLIVLVKKTWFLPYKYLWELNSGCHTCVASAFTQFLFNNASTVRNTAVSLHLLRYPWGKQQIPNGATGLFNR